jgi:hypothetical protein
MIRIWLLSVLCLGCSNSSSSGTPDMAHAPRVLSLDTTPSPIPAAMAQSLIAGDVNGDGKPDLVTTGNGALHAFLNKGDGTFGSSVDSPPGTAELASPLFGDFNGDGKLDVAVAHPGTGTTVGVLLGNGDGTFQATKDSPTSEANPWSVAKGDLNNDGKLDLVAPISSPTKSVNALLGNGDGSFQTAKVSTAGDDPEYAAVADLDGDGKLDLVVTNWGAGGVPSVSVALGNGDGTFKAPSLSSPAAAGAPVRGVALGDLNGDGKPDVVVGVGPGVAVLLNDGHGGLKAPLTYAVGMATFELALADFDGDGRLDVAALALGDGKMGILLGAGDGSLASAKPFTIGAIQGILPGHLAIADFNGDGLPDAAVLASDGIHMARNTSH